MSFISVLDNIGKTIIKDGKVVAKDAEVALTYVVKELPAAIGLASLLFPVAVAPLSGAQVATTLIQNTVILVEQKYAALNLPSSTTGSTSNQKLQDVLNAIGGAVKSELADPTIVKELASAGIVVDDTYVQNLISAVVGILNVNAPKPVASTVAANGAIQTTISPAS